MCSLANAVTNNILVSHFYVDYFIYSILHKAEAIQRLGLEWVEGFSHRRLLEPIGNVPISRKL